jgi:hypothetical protein
VEFLHAERQKSIAVLQMCLKIPYSADTGNFCVLYGPQKKNSDYLAVQREHTEFLNWDAECSLRGTSQIFNCSSGCITFGNFDIFWLSCRFHKVSSKSVTSTSYSPFRTYPELMSPTFLQRFIAICSHEIKKKHSPGYASRLRGYIQHAEHFP